MSTFRTAVEHAKHHIKYPASREEVVAACNNFADVPKEDATWFSKNLPKGTYRNPEQVFKALLDSV